MTIQKIPNLPKTANEWKNELETVGYYPADGLAEKIAHWASTTQTLFISGPQFGGKTALVDAIIQVLNSRNGLHLGNYTEIVFRVHNSFADLFYEWNGILREQFLKFQNKKDSDSNWKDPRSSSAYIDEGFLYHILKNDMSLQNLVIDFYNGVFTDEKTDQALAHFIEKKEILITESGEVVSLPENHNLLIFIVQDSYKQSENFAYSATYRVLEKDAFHLQISEPSRKEQFNIFKRMCPQLPPQLVEDFVVFVEYLNNMPDAYMETSFGERMEVMKLMAVSRVEKLTSTILVDYIGDLVKNQHDYHRFKEDVEKILRMVEAGEISFSD